MTRSAPCPSCSKPVEKGHETFPFCCQRCRAVDLGSWLGEAYRVAGPPPAELEDAVIQQLLEGSEDEWPSA